MKKYKHAKITGHKIILTAVFLFAISPRLFCLEDGVDSTIKAGDDFFAFANGEWIKSTTIPDGKGRWGIRDEIKELADQQIAQLMKKTIAHPVGKTARKVVDFRAAFMNVAAIETKGITPMLKSIDNVDNKVELAQLLGSMMRADVDPTVWGVYNSSRLLGLSVELGLNGEKNYVTFLTQGGLGLPDREYYLSTDAKMQSLRNKYRAYIEQTLSMAGFDQVKHRAKAVMVLETSIARTHATRKVSSKVDNAKNLWNRANFSRQAAGMDWSKFFAAAGLSKQQDIVVWQPSAIIGVADLVKSQPLEVWLDYLRFHLIDTYADILPRAYADHAFALHGTEVSGVLQQTPRAQRAMTAVKKSMSDAIGRMYVEHHFPAAVKAQIQNIAVNVANALSKRVEAATWMSPESKKLAIKKIKKVYFGVGYPEKWQDYSDLLIDPTDAVGNLQRLSKWKYKKALARLGQAVDNTQWFLTPQTVGAVLIFEQHSYNFPAAFLQLSKFDPLASDATNYGAIGAIIGHELIHFVDALGADYDIKGRKINWWTQQEIDSYKLISEPLVNQFSNYKPFVDLAVNGKLGLVENTADLGGLAASFEAYRLTLGDKANDPEYLKQQDRQFFIGFARSWRSKYHEDTLRKQTISNHAPENYRISTVRNIDAWYEAFDVQPGQKLYLEPKDRIRIW